MLNLIKLHIFKKKQQQKPVLEGLNCTSCSITSTYEEFKNIQKIGF